MCEALSKKQAKKYGNLIYKKWISKLTDKEIKSLKKYKFDSKRINKKTREGVVDEEVVAISSAIRKSVVDRNIVVWRESHVKFLESNDKTIDTVCVGDRLLEKGFMSTFLYRPIWACKGKVRLKIYIPKGTKGAYINRIICWHRWEHEMLFDRNSLLEVKKISVDKKRIVMEMIMVASD